MIRYCSIPDIGNLRKWYGKNFNNCCEYHDACYDIYDSRFKADIQLVKYMHYAIKNKTTFSKIRVYYPTIILTFILVRCFGWKRFKKN